MSGCRLGEIIEEEFHCAIMLFFCVINVIESNLEKYSLSAWLTLTDI